MYKHASIFTVMPKSACHLHIQPPMLESHYEMEETFWEPASTYEDVYEQIAAKNKQQLGNAASGVILLEMLGEGAFGMVYKGEWASSPGGPVQVAVKTLHSQEEENRYKLLKEAAIMGQFNHPNVVKMLGVEVSNEQVRGVHALTSDGCGGYYHAMYTTL